MTGPRAKPLRRCVRPTSSAVALLPAAVALLLAACETIPPPGAATAAPPTTSIATLFLRPAERALIEGIRLYEEASFERAEAMLQQALAAGLADRRDRAIAHKYIAFIACAFNRLAQCEANFASAFAADPSFALGDKEIGHPVWGPVYRQVAAAQAK